MVGRERERSNVQVTEDWPHKWKDCANYMYITACYMYMKYITTIHGQEEGWLHMDIDTTLWPTFTIFWSAYFHIVLIYSLGLSVGQERGVTNTIHRSKCKYMYIIRNTLKIVHTYPSLLWFWINLLLAHQNEYWYSINVYLYISMVCTCSASWLQCTCTCTCIL